MKKVVCSGYNPQSSLCNASAVGRCGRIRAEVDDAVRLGLKFRCPRSPYISTATGGKIARYVCWAEGG